MKQTNTTTKSKMSRPDGRIFDGDGDEILIRAELTERYLGDKFVTASAKLIIDDESIDFSQMSLLIENPELQNRNIDGDEFMPSSAVINQVAVILLNLFKDLQEIENREAMKNDTSD